MKRAAELFTFELRSSRSPLIEQTWQTRSEPEQSFISVAVSHWEMVVTRQRGAARLTVRGPETTATTAPLAMKIALRQPRAQPIRTNRSAVADSASVR